MQVYEEGANLSRASRGMLHPKEIFGFNTVYNSYINSYIGNEVALLI